MNGAVGAELVRRLLRLAPRHFRERHGDDVVECYRDAWIDEAKGRGWGMEGLFWLRALGSTAALVARQHITSRDADGGKGDMGVATRTAWKLALRRLRRRPRYAAAVVLTLGLGIGTNAAVFSVLHSVLLAPLPYEEADQLIRIHGARLDEPGTNRLHLPTPGALELRDEIEGLSGVAVLENQSPSGVDITDGPTPERLRSLRVSADYFSVLRVSPVLGRSFERSEENPDATVAIVTERIWDTYVGGGPDALGSTITLDGRSVSVVGVVPDRFRDPLEGSVDVYLPLDLQTSATNWQNNWLTVIARRAATSEVLRSQLNALEARHAEVGGDVSEKGYAVVELRAEIVGDTGFVLAAIMGAVLLLLLMTAVNVASLMVAQASARARELAVRVSMGAPRRHLVHDFLTESLILSAAGGAIGVVLGRLALTLIVAVAPPGLPRIVEVSAGMEVHLATGIASVVLGLALGFATALPFSNPPTNGLAGGGRRGEAIPAARRLRTLLVRAEVTLAVVLLIGAGTLLRSVQALQTRDVGADPAGVLTFRVGLPGVRYGSDPAIYEFSRRLHEEVERIPNVISAGVTSRLPVTGSFNTWGTKRAHGPDAPFDTPNQAVNQRWIAGGYFETVGLSLTRGRDFDATDEASAPYSTVVNEALVRSMYGDQDPIGTWLRMAGRFAMIVGVVEDEALTARTPAEPVAYHHQRQWISGSREMTQVVRVDGDPEQVLPAVREAVATVDSDLVVFDVSTLGSRIGRSVSTERFAAQLLTAFGLLALLVAGLGLYALLSQHVRRQRHEIGVRVALGANRAGIVGLVVARGMHTAAGGVVAGIVLALLSAGFLEPLLFEVEPRDPISLGLAPLVLGLVAFLASFVPALQATRIQPAEAFRSD